MDAPLLPSQFVGANPDGPLPERRLMVAVLVLALADYQKDAAATDLWGRRRFAECRKWFASANAAWPFSFGAICEALTLDVSSIRAGVRACQRRPPIAAPGAGFFGRG
jgi:hypothetical protein